MVYHEKEPFPCIPASLTRPSLARMERGTSTWSGDGCCSGEGEERDVCRPRVSEIENESEICNGEKEIDVCSCGGIWSIFSDPRVILVLRRVVETSGILVCIQESFRGPLTFPCGICYSRENVSSRHGSEILNFSLQRVS